MLAIFFSFRCCKRERAEGKNKQSEAQGKRRRERSWPQAQIRGAGTAESLTALARLQLLATHSFDLCPQTPFSIHNGRKTMDIKRMCGLQKAESQGT